MPLNDQINQMAEPPAPKGPVLSVKGLLTVIFGPEQAEMIMPSPPGPMDILKAVMGPAPAPPSGQPMLAPPQPPMPAAPPAPAGPPPMMGGPNGIS